MAHPFHTRIEQSAKASERLPSSRRTFLSWLTAGTGATIALLAVRPAEAQRSRTRFNRGQYGVTTQALGEEGGNRPSYTTKAMGEEGGRYTTYATGEEGGVTTYALGEEGGPYYRPAPPPPTTVTTYAIGEEG